MLKIVLIVIGVFVFLGVLSIGGMIYAAHRIKERIENNVYATENGKDSTVDTPFGQASTNQSDARDLARQMGVDVYPGAQGGESSTAQFGKMSTATIRLTTSDSVDKVAAFLQVALSQRDDDVQRQWQIHPRRQRQRRNRDDDR